LTKNDKLTQKRQQALQRAAATYDQFATLHHEVGQRLLARLAPIALSPTTILDLGCHTGYFTQALLKQFNPKRLYALDLAPNMLLQTKKRLSFLQRRRVSLLCGGAGALPLGNQSVDLVFSNLALPWCPDLATVFAEIARVLKPGGCVIFSSYGPDTLQEVRKSWAAADALEHVNAFMDMHDVGSLLSAQRLQQPVLDVDRIEMVYPSLNTLMRSLKGAGDCSVAEPQRKSLTGKQRFARFRQAFEACRRSDGGYPATYEIVFGHAFAANIAALAQSSSTEFSIPVSSIGKRR
jgi:malonyl-CoA O-methyltransferase